MGAKEYELPNGRKAVFEFDENGVGKITIEAMDMLMELINIDLVRCGECMHYTDHDCPIDWESLTVNDFCSYGERRSDE